MITKIVAQKIKRQLNMKMLVWDCNNLIESKQKTIMKNNIKLKKN
jgi:hypothetical protein